MKRNTILFITHAVFLYNFVQFKILQNCNIEKLQYKNVAFGNLQYKFQNLSSCSLLFTVVYRQVRY